MMLKAQTRRKEALKRALFIKRRALAKEKDERAFHHIQNLEIKHRAKQRSRAYNARRKAAIRRCMKKLPKHKMVYVKKSYWVKKPKAVNNTFVNPKRVT